MPSRAAKTQYKPIKLKDSVHHNHHNWKARGKCKEGGNQRVGAMQPVYRLCPDQGAYPGWTPAGSIKD